MQKRVEQYKRYGVVYKNTGVNQTCMHAWLHGDHSAATMKLIYLLDTDNLQCSFNYYFNVRFCATT